MISQNHFKQPIRAFVLDMFDIQLDENILEKIRQAEHVLERIAIPVVDREVRSGQHRHMHADQEQAKPVKPVIARLTSYSQGAPTQANLNDPSIRTRQVLEPVAKQEGFQSHIKGDEQEALFL